MTVLILLFAFTPPVLQLWLAHRRPSLRGPTATSIIVLAYTLFFPLRGISLLLFDHPSVELAVRGNLEGAYRSMILQAAVGTTALVCSSAAFASQSRRRPRLMLADGLPVRRKLRLLFLASGALTIAALTVLLIKNHGLAGLAERYADHAKLGRPSPIESAALAAWLAFAPLACWASTALVAARLTSVPAAVSPSRRLRQVPLMRLLAPAVFVAFVAFFVVMGFGSRKVLTAIAVGAAIVWHHHVRPVTWRTLMIIGPMAVLTSVLIVSVRTEVDSDRPTNERVVANLGHSVLDAGGASLIESASISADYDAASRFLSLPLYAVPRAVWPSAPSIDDARMDVIVARNIGTANHADTGFPTSVFFEARLLGGLLGIVGFGVALGYLSGISHGFFVADRPVSFVSSMLYGHTTFVLLSWFKDGDAVAILSGAVRGYGYLAFVLIPIGAVRLVRRRRYKPASTAVGSMPAAR